MQTPITPTLVLVTAGCFALYSYSSFFNDPATTEIYTLSLHDALPISETESLYRVFYVIGAYDGTNRRFLKAWLAGGKKDFKAALARTGGKAHVAKRVNKHIEKVGINRADVKSIIPWNPAEYRHGRPTLILNGDADVVTAAGQAEHYFNFGLIGYRILVTFRGVGHDVDLPATNPPSPILDDACQRGDVDPVDCLVASFVELPPKSFFSEATVLFG